MEFKSATSHCSKAPYKGQSQRQATLTEKALKQKVMRITGSVLRLQRQKAISPLHSQAETLCVFSEPTTASPRKGTLERLWQHTAHPYSTREWSVSWLYPERKEILSLQQVVV